jgi:hypothetical protein
VQASTFEKIKGAELYTVEGGDHHMRSTHAEEINPLIEKFILKFCLQQLELLGITRNFLYSNYLLGR